MSTRDRNLDTPFGDPGEEAKLLKIGVVVSQWNDDITGALLSGCLHSLSDHHIPSESIQTIQVPGTFELVGGADVLARKHELDAIICLGCVIKGETSHNEYINHSVASALQDLTIKHHLPFIFGVLTPNDKQQALDRAGGKHGNKGTEAALTAIEMGLLYKQQS